MQNRIADLRREQGWTQADLAGRLEVSRQTVISLEQGRYDPSLPLAFRIAEVFDCRIEDVFSPPSVRAAGGPGRGRAGRSR